MKRDSQEEIERFADSLRDFLMLDAGDGGDGFAHEDKVKWLAVADHIGPDWCQKLYHAAVFATKVA